MNLSLLRRIISAAVSVVAAGLLAGLVTTGCGRPTRSTTTHVVGWGYNQSGEATGAPAAQLLTGLIAGLKAIQTSGKPDPRWATGVVSLAGTILTNVSAIAAGVSYSLALNSDGTVVSWGQNGRGIALGYDTGHYSLTNGLVKIGGQLLTNVVAICAGNQSVALTRDGTAVTWGTDNKSGIPHFIPDVVAIASAGQNVATVKRDGSVKVWGSSYEAPNNWNDTVAVALASSFQGHGIALRSNHTVFAWGLWLRSECQVENAVDIVAIAAGQEHYIALRNDGVVLEWGDYAPPMAGSLSIGHPAIGLACYPAIVDGRVLDNVVAIAAGGTRRMALKRDGTVVIWGTSDWENRSSVPARLGVPAGLNNVTAIAAGDDFSLALTTNDPPLPATK